MNRLFELPLRGAGGEPISFARTIHSHGCARLPPASIDTSPLVYRRRFRVGKRVVEVAMHEEAGRLVAQSAVGAAARREAHTTQAAIARMFRFRDDLSPFYAQIADDDALSWAGTRRRTDLRQSDRL